MGCVSQKMSAKKQCQENENTSSKSSSISKSMNSTSITHKNYGGISQLKSIESSTIFLRRQNMNKANKNTLKLD